MTAIIKWLSLAVLACVSAADMFYNKDVMVWSGKISYYMQENGGKPVHIIAAICSSAFTFWMPITVVVYNHLSNNSRDSLYHFVKYFTAVGIGVFFKMLMYQGRPYLACEDIKGCTCDPGMPSGHAIMAISGYYMIYVIFTEKIEAFSIDRHAIRAAMLKVTCYVLGLSIIWSRIALGAHSVDQLFIGSMIAINVILWFDKPAFEKLYDKLEHHSVLISVSYSILIFALGVTFLFVNHEYREDREFLKYWDKCLVCKGTMVVSQSLNSSISQIVPGALLYYPYDRKRRQKAHHESYSVYHKPAHRFAVFFVLAVLLPGLVFMGIEAIKNKYLHDVYVASVFLLCVVGPLFFYVGMAMSYFNELAYSRFGLDAMLEHLVEDEDDDELLRNERCNSFYQPGDTLSKKITENNEN